MEDRASAGPPWKPSQPCINSNRATQWGKPESMSRSLDIYIRWDSREPIAFDVAKRTIVDHASIPVRITPIVLNDLVERKVYTREVDPLASTEFTYSRFFTPWLNGYQGWALFCDCDFLFFADVADLLQYQDESKAVACVKHDYKPKEGLKMDGKVQTTYPRKNWSSSCCSIAPIPRPARSHPS